MQKQNKSKKEYGGGPIDIQAAKKAILAEKKKDPEAFNKKYSKSNHRI